MGWPARVRVSGGTDESAGGASSTTTVPLSMEIAGLRRARTEPVNALEAREDAEGHWRRYVNACLAGGYADFFAGLDLRLMLRAPSFACVHGWRMEQEAGLSRDARSARPAMTDAELARFIAHYERLTNWILEDEPADLIADIDERRAPFAWRLGKSP